MVMKALIKMINNPRDKDQLPTKQEANAGPDDHKAYSAMTSNSGVWSGGLKNPRIVRVSRAFGGKDRHSKVSTIRGLRDRRVRLSVPTAIQLYDLQHRLGVNQPSKVVDWLLNAAQEEIDKLPPLQIPFVQIGPQSEMPDSLAVENFKYTNINAEGLTAFPQSTYNWTRSEQEVDGQLTDQQKVNNYHWEASNAYYLSQLGNRSYQAEGQHMSLAPGVMPSMFPSYVQMQMALQTPQLNDTGDHLQLGGPSVRHFQ